MLLSCYYLVTRSPVGQQEAEASVLDEVRAAYALGHDGNEPFRNLLVSPDTGMDHRPVRSVVLTSSFMAGRPHMLVAMSNMLVNSPRVCVQDRLEDWFMHIMVRRCMQG